MIPYWLATDSGQPFDGHVPQVARARRSCVLELGASSHAHARSRVAARRRRAAVGGASRCRRCALRSPARVAATPTARVERTSPACAVCSAPRRSLEPADAREHGCSRSVGSSDSAGGASSSGRRLVCAPCAMPELASASVSSGAAKERLGRGGARSRWSTAARRERRGRVAAERRQRVLESRRVRRVVGRQCVNTAAAAAHADRLGRGGERTPAHTA